MRAARAAAVLGALVVSACATNPYAPQLYLSSSSHVQCPGSTVLMCKHVDSAQECSCTSTSMFWSE
jgi:hypothetical protein